MRLAVINCILLALSAAALAEESRPRRHLHQIKQLVVNTLFGGESNCTQPTEEPPAPPPLETKFFRIPGFNNVVIKAVPKGSNPEPAPVYEDEELPPNSHIGIVGSYLGTRTVNETYNALLGVRNLLISGILTARRDELQALIPAKVQVPSKLIKPCAAPGLSPPLEPIRVLVRPPKIPVVPTQYSYKQVNQDGSLSTYTSSLDLENGIRVIEDGKPLPFFIDRVRKLPVRLPVPVLPEVSKIIVSEAVHPSTYSYQQIHHDGRMTSYMGLPLPISVPGPVVVAETVKIPPPPVYVTDRIEKVAAIASFPRAQMINAAPKPSVTGHIPNAPVKGSPVPDPGPSGYSYSQMTVNGGMTTHSASGANGAVLVTENGLPAPLNAAPSWLENNPFGPRRGYGFSYGHVQGGGQMTSFNRGDQAGPVNVVEHRPAPPSMPLPPNSFSYKQIGDGKMVTYTGSGITEESHDAYPAVVVHGMDHPVPPHHITDRIEKIAAGAKFNRPPFSPPFVPIPTGFVHIPSVQTLAPQQPVKVPIPSRPSSFMYKHIHSDGSVTSYGGEGVTENEKAKLPPAADVAKPFPQGNVRIIESDNGPFPMNPVNPNAFKPSTPVSGSYSYKMVNHPPVGAIDVPIVDTFAPPPPLPSIPATIEGCVDPDVTPSGYFPNPLNRPAVLFEKPVPLTYSYKQISHSNPNPFLVVNVEDPVMDVKKVGMKLNHDNHAHAYQPLPLPPAPFPAVNVLEHKPVFVQPAPFVPAPIEVMPVLQPPAEFSPPSSYSYKQVTSQGYQPQPLQPANNGMQHRPVFIPPQMNNMHLTNVQKETSPSSSFSYKQVVSQALPPLPTPPQSTDNVMEHNPNAMQFIPAQNSDMHLANVPSSFSYKQVTSQETRPLPSSSQPADNEMEHRLSAPPVPPPTINSRGQIQKDSAPSSFPYKQVTNQGYPQPLQPLINGMEHRPNVFVSPQMNNMHLANVQKETSPSSSFSYKQVVSQALPPLPTPPQPTDNFMEHNPNAMQFIPAQNSDMHLTNVPSSFSYKQVTSQGYQPQPLQPANNGMQHRPVFIPPQMNNMHLTNVQKETSPSSSFSYKQVVSQALPPLPTPPQSTDNVMEHKPNAMQFIPAQNSDMHLTNVPSSYSYKQVTSQETRPLSSSSQPADNEMEHILSAPPVPPPTINSRGQNQKDSAPSSFSYKQVTNQGVYEYADEFPSGIKTNLQSNPLYPQDNPSGDVYVEQGPLPDPSIPMTVSASPMPIPSRTTPTFERRNSLSNNPIVVPEQSSFSFKSSNADGSTITVQNGDGGVAVQLEEAPKAESSINSQEPTVPAPPAPIANEAQRTEPAFVNESTAAPLPENDTRGPVTGQAKPKRRRVIKRVKSVKQHRGDIPDTE